MATQLLTFGGNHHLVGALAHRGVRFLVVGGSAARFFFPEWQTDDLDLLIEPSVENAGRVTLALQDLACTVEGWTSERLAQPRVQLSLKGRMPFNADILTPSAGFDFETHWRGAQDATIGTTAVKVASIDTIVLTMIESPEARHREQAEQLRILKVRDAIKTTLARALDPKCPTAILPLKQSDAGGSGAFLVRADDGRRYWCKCLQSPQGARVALNEQVVGRLAHAIGAAACEVSLVRIPKALEGWEFRTGHKLTASFAHGSLAVEPAVETRSIQHPSDDDNPKRLTTLHVLADWCWAADSQWLYAPNEENRYFSHDHGHYFPFGPNWTIAALQGNQPTDVGPGAGVLPVADLDSLKTIRSTLLALDAQAIAGILAGMPAEWPVSDEELVELVLFLDKRRKGVIDRLTNRLSPGGSL